MLANLFVAAGLFAGQVDPALAAHLATLAPGDEVRVLVHYEDPYDAAALLEEASRLPRRERAALVRSRLLGHAHESQRRFRRDLRQADRGRITRDEMLWVANARAVTCEADLVRELAELPGVAHVTWDPPLDPSALHDAAPAPDPSTTTSTTGSAGSSARATPNVLRHQAVDLWNVGIDGSGVLILEIDGGVANDHPDLASSIWRNPGEVEGNGVDDDGNGFVDDTWGWDFVDGDASPWDPGHGTHVAGILVGDGTTNGGAATGMAPGASLAVARVGSASQMLAAYQYAITIGADVVSSSYSLKWPSRPDYHAFRSAMEAELAAGIVHANSIGNHGLLLATDPVPWNISTPGNCPGPWIHPQQAVGGRASVLGVAGILLGNDVFYPASGVGPAAWEDVRDTDATYPHAQDARHWDYPWANGTRPGLLKPDISAYTFVRTTAGRDSYTTFGGTSAATPHVGGALCLLLQANPNALPRQVSQALQETALDLSKPGKDTRTGAGKLLVRDAAERLVSLVTTMPNDPAPGEPFDLVLSGPADAPFLLGIGSQPGPSPTGLGVDAEIADAVLLLAGNHAGHADPLSYRIVVPPNPALSGLTLYFQMLTDDRGGASGRWLLSLLEPLTIR